MRYAIPVFAQDNHRYGDLGGFAKEGLKRRFALGQGRKSVGVQNHRRSSGSICSNSRSIRRLILAVSGRKCRSLPKAAIQGLPRPFSAWSLSATASETKAQKGIPRSAARDLARRKMLSGISRVVFMALFSRIYGRGSKKSLLHQKLWQKLRVEEHRGGGERERWGTWLLPGREKHRASERKQVRPLRR